MEKIITVEQLKKSYGKVEAVKGIDFYVEKGKLFSFLGTNGAGKSTTIDILCTLLKPDSGVIRIDGLSLGSGKEDNAIRHRIGVVFQDSVLDPLLTVKENLNIRARFYGLTGQKRTEAVQAAARDADISEFLSRPYGKLSGGLKRRADIARALVNRPKILFLDEPTTGLDPKTRESVWKTIGDIQSQTGMTVFLTTHYMEEASSSDYIIIIDHGRIAVKGTPYDLREKYSFDTLRIKPAEGKDVASILSRHGLTYRQDGPLLISRLSRTTQAIPVIQEAAPFMESFEVIHGTMDDVFLRITEDERA